MNLPHEYRVFLSYPWNMRVLLVTNWIYALLLPAVDLFVSAYVMRNSHEARLVIAYQLAIFTSTPLIFLFNGYLLRIFSIKRLYSAGMLLGSLSLLALMGLPTLNFVGIILTGLMMGISFGMFWANRDFLALSSTDDGNRNYYYGIETFFYTITSIIVPGSVGGFIASSGEYGWFGGDRNTAYRIVGAVFFLCTVISSIAIHQGKFTNPPSTRLVYWRFHPLWHRMLLMAGLKGLGQGFMVTAPAILIMQQVGEEGTLGLIQSAAGVFSAFVLYLLGRTTRPEHRIWILAAGLLLFAGGAVANAIWFDTASIIIFVVCILLGRQLLDAAYFPIQMRVIELLAAIEQRSVFAYLFNHEVGLYVGRLFGCGLFIAIATWASELIAVRYTLVAIGVLQLVTFFVARVIIGCCHELSRSSAIKVPDDGSMTGEEAILALPHEP